MKLTAARNAQQGYDIELDITELVNNLNTNREFIRFIASLQKPCKHPYYEEEILDMLTGLALDNKKIREQVACLKKVYLCLEKIAMSIIILILSIEIIKYVTNIY